MFFSDTLDSTTFSDSNYRKHSRSRSEEQGEGLRLGDTRKYLDNTIEPDQGSSSLEWNTDLYYRKEEISFVYGGHSHLFETWNPTSSLPEWMRSQFR